LGKKKKEKKNTGSSLQKGSFWVVKRNEPKKKKTLDVVLSYLGNRLYSM
jgi:hypothetical protein